MSTLLVGNKFEKYSTRVPGNRGEVRFVLITFFSAGFYFIASVITYFYLTIDEFGILSGTLVIATIGGVVLQLGATYGLPRLAKNDNACLGSEFIVNMVLTCSLSSGVIAIAYLYAPINGIVVKCAYVSAVIGTQLICDALLRARTCLRLLCLLNLSANILLLCTILMLWYTETLSASTFLNSFMLVKCLFILVVCHQEIGKPRLGKRSFHSIFHSTAKSSLTLTFVYTLGALDVLIIVFWGNDGAAYIGVKHFGYGIYIAVVQEGVMPILIRRLVHSNRYKLSSILLWSLATGVVVGVGATFIGIAMARMNGTLTTDIVYFSSLVGAGLSVHTGVIILLKTRFVLFGIKSIETLICLLGVYASSVIYAFVFEGYILFLAANWVLVNLLTAVWTIYKISWELSH